MQAAAHRSAPAAALPAQAGTEGPPRSLLRMAVGDEPLAVPIEQVREILQLQRLTPLPRTPGFVRGVMNLRGAVVPVIDLAARLGLPPVALGRRSCIVVVRAPEAQGGEGDPGSGHGTPTLGLLVDAVYEVFDRTPADIEPAPALGTTVAPRLLAGMTRADGRLVGVLALDQVLAPPELAACIASFQTHQRHQPQQPGQSGQPG